MAAQAIIPPFVVFVACVVATITDIRRFKIYNTLTLPLLAAGLSYHLWESGLPGLGSSATGTLLGFIILFIPYLAGGMGGGDVKLMAAIGAWLGASATLAVAGVGCAAASIYSLAILHQQGRLQESWLGLQVMFFRLHALASRLGCDDEREQLRAEVRQMNAAKHTAAGSPAAGSPAAGSPAAAGRRMVPFSIMLAIGVVATVVVEVWWMR